MGGYNLRKLDKYINKFKRKFSKNSINVLFANDEKKRLEAYRYLLDKLKGKYDTFSASIGLLEETEIKSFLTYLLIFVGRNGFLNFERRSELFDIAEKMGIHIMPTHFYNPVPVVNELSDEVWKPYDVNGLGIDSSKQLKLLLEMKEYIKEMDETPLEKTEIEHQFYFNNPALSGMDAFIYHGFIRKFNPKTILEVGSGYSTMVAAKAALSNKSTELHIIEPFPFDFLRNGFPGLSRLIEKKVQEVPLEEFKKLKKNDILFIDNSHVSKIGSDVNYLFLRILPQLNEGVIVHIHDIFLPYEYPEEWVKDKKIFWNEQYLLHSFLLCNDQYEVLMSNFFLGMQHQIELKEIMPRAQHFGGGSFWIRKKEK
jgi:hypothetical protein